MKETAVEWFAKELIKRFKRSHIHYTDSEWSFDMIKKLSDQAKEMEKKDKLKHQLFVGKVSDVIGFDKTLELLKESNKEII